jgi:hypothetical protein
MKQIQTVTRTFSNNEASISYAPPMPLLGWLFFQDFIIATGGQRRT